MKAISNSPVFQIATAAAVIGGVYLATEASIPALQNLPISELRSTAPHPSNSDLSVLNNLYPLVAKASPKPTPLPAADDLIQVDDAFIPRNSSGNQEPGTPAVIDYFPLLESNHVLVLQAVTSDGAIINKRFYTYYSPLTEWAYPGLDGKNVSPVLLRAGKGDRVRIAEPATSSKKRHFELVLQQ
ncbi:MAG: hypothetical protein BGO63_15250 [Candidatus Accumulibacter sp. 66-26]|nr:hypothetical protein [Accumulibacter sp.]OJW52263.1 MAG: hypothetical protein BGO63_15250 [Candidatus Accumulibacter sp. 66-26]